MQCVWSLGVARATAIAVVIITDLFAIHLSFMCLCVITHSVVIASVSYQASIKVCTDRYVYLKCVQAFFLSFRMRCLTDGSSYLVAHNCTTFLTVSVFVPMLPFKVVLDVTFFFVFSFFHLHGIFVCLLVLVGAVKCCWCFFFFSIIIIIIYIVYKCRYISILCFFLCDMCTRDLFISFDI